MPSGTTAKRLLAASGVALAILLVVGFVMGAIGAALFDTSSFLSKPEVHLPIQPVFPADIRDSHIHIEVEDHAGSGEGAKEEPEPLGIMDFAITNSMLSSLLATIVLVLVFVVGASRKRLVPGRLQNLVEMIIEALLNFVEGVVGREMSRKVFPMIATIFLFVLFNAWLALFPIYPSLGFLDTEGNMKVHLLRSAGTDLNMPLALALVSFFFVEYWGFRTRGFAYLGKFFPIGRLLKRGPSAIIDMFVGLLEAISEMVRIVSFTFRLFGNMTAGEILVLMIAFLVPFVALEFVYGLELLVGLVQALIFAGLTLVFVSVAMVHEEEH